MRRRIAAKTGRTAAMQGEAYGWSGLLPRLAARVVATVVLAGTLAAGVVQAQERPAMPDAAITAQVEAVIARDPALGAMAISVTTQDSVVTLTGFVRSLDDVVKAGEMAGAVKGVSAVRNSLRVADRPSRG